MLSFEVSFPSLFNFIIKMDNIVPSKLDKVQFSFYTNEEALSLSHHRITSALAYDSNKQPLEGGLYDQTMGVSPHSLFVECKTCGWEASGCQGHIGHIELASPIYNPFLFELAYKLMKSKCSDCHRIRIPDDKSKQFVYKFMLLNKGRITDSLAIEEQLSLKVIHDRGFEDLDDIRGKLIDEKNIQEELIRIASKNGTKIRSTTYVKTKSDLSSKIWKNVISNICPHCKKKQPKITKENHVKIFRHPLREK